MPSSAARLFIILALLGVPALASCTSPAEERAAAEAQEAADRKECAELGFDPGTEGFGQCLLRLREIRAREWRPRGPRIGFGLGLGFGL